MSRRPAQPVLVQVAALLAVSILAAQAISFGIIVLAPPPEPPRISVRQVVEAVRATPQGQLDDRVLKRRLVAEPPIPPTPPSAVPALIAQRIADALAVSPRDVRVSTQDVADNSQAPSQLSAAGPAGSGVTIVPGPRAARPGPGRTPLHNVLDDVSFGAFTTAVRQPDGRWLVVEPASPFFSSWHARVLLALLLSAVVLALLSWWGARILTRPIRLFAEASERLGQNPDAPPLEEGGPLEVRTAVASFNGMQDRLREYVERRTAMVAALAHDLRTPLTSLRIRAESAPAATRDRMVADITRMDAMISQVLAFVRGEQMREPRGKLDLAELLRSCAADAPPESVDIRLAEADALEVCGEALNLRRALHNVIDNAVKYGRHAQVTLSREGRYACITIDDAGPGLPEEEFERVFEPFHRLEPSRNPETGGVGLGLALARAVVRAHDGAIRLSNRREGGLRVRVALPLAA